MTYPTPAYGRQPPQRRRGLHPLAIVGIVLGSVLVLCCFGAGAFVLLSGQDDEPAAQDEPASAQPTGGEEAVPGIGDPARDGKFEFTVTEVETGVDRVGDEIFGKEARGQFVLVHVTVENIGDEARTFIDGNQELIDTEGREHSADSEAALYIENSESFYTEINPGLKVEGLVVFDIPVDATPASLELHDSFLSGGVEVALADADGES